MADKNIEKIKAVIKVFERTKMDIEIEKEMVTGDIKGFYAQNRNPPPALLMRWKQLENLEVFSMNNIYSLQNR